MKGGHSFQSYSFWIQSINTTTSTTTTMNWLHGVTPISLQLDNVLLDIFIVLINKQLLDEVEHEIMNYQNRGLCYLPKPKAEADKTDTRF